ncbi:MAG TPA: nucleotide disphospho-sugar-binding domain-containing protein [Candidatus Dormibacteraeota bacterium]
MRLAFCTSAGYGHFLPVVPLAWAARSAGHDVLVVTAAAAVRASVAAGLPTVNVRPRAGEPGRGAMASGTLPRAQYAMPDRPMAVRMVAALEAWRPDLVVTEHNDFLAPVAAAALSIPVVVHGLGVLPVPPTLPPTPPFVASAFDDLFNGSAAPCVAGRIDTCPPSLREEPQPRVWPMRHVPYNGGCVLPDWLRDPRSMPRVCLTLGTVVPALAELSHVRALTESVRGLDAEVILVLGDTDPAQLGDVAANVRLTGWLPLSELLPACDVIVHHGGAGTIMSAVVAGVPQCVLPFRDGAIVQRRGIGVALDAEAGLSAEGIRRAIELLLREPAYGAAAAEVRREVAAMPAPAEVLCRMEGVSCS